MTEYGQVRKQLEFTVCSEGNGDPENCKPDYCEGCTFVLPPILEILDGLFAKKHPNGEPMLLVGAQDQSRPKNPYSWQESPEQYPDKRSANWHALRRRVYDRIRGDYGDYRRILKGENDVHTSG